MMVNGRMLSGGFDTVPACEFSHVLWRCCDLLEEKSNTQYTLLLGHFLAYFINNISEWSYDFSLIKHA